MCLGLGFCKVDPKFRTPEQVAYLGGIWGLGKAAAAAWNLTSSHSRSWEELSCGPSTVGGGCVPGLPQSGKGPSVHFSNGFALSAVVTGQPFKQEKATLASIRHQNHLEEITPGFLIQ